MNVLVLPSVNLEFYLTLEESPNGVYSKVPVTDYEVTVGGSSLNIAMALKSAGYNPTLFAFIGKQDDGLEELFLHHLNKLSVTHNVLSVLAKNNIAFIDRHKNENSSHTSDTIKGHKSPFHNGIDLVSEMSKIKGQYDTKIASGISEKEIPIINALFTKESTNVLIPKKALLEKCGKDIKSVFPDINIMCIDLNEFKASGVSSLSDFGIDLVTVTDEDRKGSFCFHGTTREFFPKSHPSIVKVFQTGGGDWFAGALNVFLDREKVSVEDSSVPIDKILEIVEKAAEVSTKKVTYPSAISGPIY